MSLDHVLLYTQTSTESLSISFGLGLGSSAARYGIQNLTDTNMSMAYGVEGENLG
jgi:hypothetical protein